MTTPLYRDRRVAPAPAQLKTCRVNDFIVQAEGFSNCYLIETDDGCIQINAGMGMEAPIQHRNFSGVSDQITKYLVLTQGHVDHVGGVQYFRDKNPGVQVIATRENLAHQEYDKRVAPFRGARSSFAFADTMMEYAGWVQSECGELPAQDIPTPDILFDDDYQFNLGGLDIQLIAVPGAETNDSLIVWLPQHEIVFTGNLFGCPWGHFPNLVTIRGDRYRDALTCAAAVKRVMDLGAKTVCYGHHEVIHGADIIAEELQRLHGAIHYVHDAVVAGMNSGKDVYDLQQNISLPDEYEVGQGYGKVSWGVKAIWEHYAGWFHHESTTELYSQPQAAIHEDLLELAGVDALVSKAKQRIAAGELVQAQQLLDIVLTQLDDQQAVNAAIDVHNQLLALSENFWLSNWLQEQIKQLQARIQN